MKRLRLRFENNNGVILTFAIISIVMGLATWGSIVNGMIEICLLTAMWAVVAFWGLLYFIFHIEVVIDFKRNRLKMKSDTMKKVCDLKKVEKLEIVFQRVENMKCYSAQVKAYLIGGKTLAVEFNSQRYRHKYGHFLTGKVYERFKKKIERQVSGYDFITCRTEK